MQNGGARPGAGRKLGSHAAHTLKAMKAKEKLIEMFFKECEPIFRALLDKARTGDVQAIKELQDRVWGKSSQPVTGEGEGEIIVRQVIVLDPETVKTYNLTKPYAKKT